MSCTLVMQWRFAICTGTASFISEGRRTAGTRALETTVELANYVDVVFRNQ